MLAEYGFIHGAKVARGAPMVSHLFFADDCFLFFSANQREASLIKYMLTEYRAASGQVVNFNKSSVSFSANVSEIDARQVCDILEVTATTNHGAYLGLPFSVGMRKNDVFTFIKDKVWNKLQGWKQKIISQAGKILLKTMAQVMSNYAMNNFLLPLDLCRELEIMMNSFWWGSKHNRGGGINWLRWDTLCKPKLVGGMGFKKLYYFNLAMLGK